MRLRRDAPDPLYLQLKETLMADIAAGRYGSHERLPSERELTEHYQVSRMTVRQALLELARDGAIYTRVGKGTFVAEPKIDQQLRVLTGFSQDVRQRGDKPSSRVLDARISLAPAEVAAVLRIAAHAEVILLARVRLADTTPLALETAYLPSALCPDLLKYNFAMESLYDVLEREYGLTLVLADQSIEAALATPREIELLGLSPPAPVLKMRRLSLTQEGCPVEYVFSTYRGDRYKFRSTLQSGASLPSLS